MGGDFLRDDFADPVDDFQDFRPRSRRRPLKPQPIRRRRGGFFRKMFVMVVLGGAAGFGAYIYTEGDRIDTSKVPALIRKIDNPFKVKPTEPGGMEVRHRNRSIFGRLFTGHDKKKGPAKPRLSAPPEEPLLPEREDGTHSGEPQRAERSRPEESGGGFPLLGLGGSSESEPPKSAVASVGHASVGGARDVQSTDLSGEYRIQLASLRSDGAVKRAWLRMQRAFPDLLGELALSVQRHDLGGRRGVFYRLQAGPLSSARSANELCSELKSRDKECIVVKP